MSDTSKQLGELKDRINKVQGVLEAIEYRIEDEQRAVELFNRVLTFFDSEANVNEDGVPANESTKRMQALALSITDWLRGRK